MLRSLRWKLTLTFLGATLALILLTTGGVYLDLQNYFQNSVDLNLKHRMASQFQLFGFTIPPELAQAELEWQQVQASTSGISTPSSSEGEGEGGNQGDGEGNEFLHEQQELLRGDYASDLILVFVMPLDENGALLFNPNPFPAPMAPDKSASQAAMETGSDLRTVSLKTGQRVRLLSYRTVPGQEPAVLQVGRSLADQDRVLMQLAFGSGAIGIVILGLVGAGAWWLAGRTLVPAQKAWDQQQSFVANASHELRTPLTLMRASTEMALRGKLGKRESELLQDVLKESDYMNRLVGDLLLLSRLDAGRLKLEKERFSVASLFDDIDRFAQKIPGGERIQIESVPASIELEADKARIRQVLLVLLDNAIKHTSAPGAIRMRAKQMDSRIDIEVADEGPGISPDHLPHIFERFYQAESSGDEQSRTSGLGLSIAKGLIELHGGTIRAESKLGQGSRFIVSIPLAI